MNWIAIYVSITQSTERPNDEAPARPHRFAHWLSQLTSEASEKCVLCTAFASLVTTSLLLQQSHGMRFLAVGGNWKFFSSSRQHKLGKTSNRTHTLIGRLTMMIGSKVSSTSTTCHRQAFKVVHLSITEKKLLLFCLRVSEFSKWNFNELKLYCVLVFSQFFSNPPTASLSSSFTVIISPLRIRKSA